MIFEPLPATSAGKYDMNATVGKRKLHPHRGNSCSGNRGCSASTQRCDADCYRHHHRCNIVLIHHFQTTNLPQIYIKFF